MIPHNPTMIPGFGHSEVTIICPDWREMWPNDMRITIKHLWISANPCKNRKQTTSEYNCSIMSHRIHVCYMGQHGSHQYTPAMLAYIPAPWIPWVLYPHGIFPLFSYTLSQSPGSQNAIRPHVGPGWWRWWPNEPWPGFITGKITKMLSWVIFPSHFHVLLFFYGDCKRWFLW